MSADGTTLGAVIATKGRPERLREAAVNAVRSTPVPDVLLIVDGDPELSAEAGRRHHRPGIERITRRFGNDASPRPAQRRSAGAVQQPLDAQRPPEAERARRTSGSARPLRRMFVVRWRLRVGAPSLDVVSVTSHT